MASSRKKQDEKNLKILRELASLPHNKYCFDCNQRGPTYVNVTIGSFVCTKCSGMLRGLAPPHRVKSISMATFTQEEIDLLCNRGNDYCKRVWLGLYENKGTRDLRDEGAIRDFMVDKYEKKLHYLEPSSASIVKTSMNGSNNTNNNSSFANQGSVKPPEVKPLSSILPQAKPLMLNGSANSISSISPPSAKSIQKTKSKETENFIADFGSANIYNATASVGTTDKRNNNSTQPSFANFDNNPIFTNNGLPTLGNTGFTVQAQNNSSGPPAPPEDRYAALKDLDNALKSQPTLDWNSGSNGSLYSSSATPTSSLYSSPSPQNSLFGSPSQGQFMSLFPPQQNSTKVSNPFSSNLMWSNDAQIKTNGIVNPFQIEAPKVNGFAQGYTHTRDIGSFATTNGQSPWGANPFALGSTTSSGHSNNPFL